MTIGQGFALGVLQGITEFIPVSSSGHLVLARAFLGVHEAPVTFEVVLHAASLVAILVFFRREIASVFTLRRYLIPILIVGTIPAGLLGVVLKVFFKSQVETLFSSPLVVGVGLLVTGTVLRFGERFARDERTLDELTWGDALFVGVAQAIAIAPGISRSGMTVGSGLGRGLERSAAVAFAFLLGAIAITGAAVLELKDIVKQVRGEASQEETAAPRPEPQAADAPARKGADAAMPLVKGAAKQPAAAAAHEERAKASEVLRTSEVSAEVGGRRGLMGPMAAGFAASLVASLAALVLLSDFVRRKRLVYLAIYCYVLGGGVLLAKLFALW